MFYNGEQRIRAANYISIQRKARNAKTTRGGKDDASSRGKPRGRLLMGAAVCVKECTDRINYATTSSWTMTTMTMQAGETDAKCEVWCEQKTTSTLLLLWCEQ